MHSSDVRGVRTMSADPADMSVRSGGFRPRTRTPDTDRAARTVAQAATELVRTALLCKLALDLDDPSLARRAARQSAQHARLLAGLDCGLEGEGELPPVADLLDVEVGPLGTPWPP